jgi:excisionase family DNA binding protein
MAMTDPGSLAAIFGALADIPARLAALEHAANENGTKLDALQAALPPKHLTITEAAKAIKVSIPTMRRWVRKGVVTTLKVGKVIRVDVSRLRGVDAAEIVRSAGEARAHSTRP